MKSALIIVMLLCAQLLLAQNASEEYVCLPCGSGCDKEVLHQSGKCQHCNMPLIKKSSVVFKEITPTEICGYVANHRNVVLLDVRTKEEFENKGLHRYGTLKNAINIPIHDLSARLSELDPYKNKEIIVYCSHSQRSPQASYLLTQNGFTKVYNMSGGLSVMKDNTCKK
jgi:rhodanese-related sulfurtransferase